ncbi:TrkA family potassium uptake protein [candidate division WOR-3 bacterium]|nr:TrkA family potassium uptake protein [candidate division WOR-3 bacterium]
MKQFAIVGLGRFGMAVAQALSEKGMQVIAIDKDEKRVKDAAEFATRALELDATDKDDLRDARVENVDAAIVGIGKDVASSVLITLILKELGVKKVISKALDPLQGKILQKVGAEQVVYPEKEMGTRLAESLMSPGISEYIKLSSGHTLIEVDIPHSFEGKTLGELEISTKYGVQVVAIKRKVMQTDKNGKVGFTEKVIVAPGADDELTERDRFVLLGENKSIEKIKKVK